MAICYNVHVDSMIDWLDFRMISEDTCESCERSADTQKEKHKKRNMSKSFLRRVLLMLLVIIIDDRLRWCLKLLV